MARQKLDAPEVSNALNELDGWQSARDGNAIARRFEFTNSARHSDS